MKLYITLKGMVVVTVVGAFCIFLVIKTISIAGVQSDPDAANPPAAPVITVAALDTAASRTREVTATLGNTDGVTDTKYALVSSAVCNGDVTFPNLQTWTSGVPIVFVSESANGKRVCFKAARGQNYTYKLSDTVSGISRSFEPTVWGMQTYIWNQHLNVWARTSCTMRIGGAIGTIAACSEAQCTGAAGTPSFCSNEPDSCDASVCDASEPWKNRVRYYHDGRDIDGDGTIETNEIQPGEVQGTAWSPMYGEITFDLEDFPVDNPDTVSVNESSCYGLTGEDRQARIVRVVAGNNNKVDRSDRISTGSSAAGTTIAMVGCAYVPGHDEYILLSPANRLANAVAANLSEWPSDWTGVWIEVDTAAPTVSCTGDKHCTGITSPHIKMFGCAWSQRSQNNTIYGNFWSFGPNTTASGAGDDTNCLPDSHSEGLLEEIDVTAIGIPSGGTDALVYPNKGSARVGQYVTYSAECPAGRSKVSKMQIFRNAGDYELVFGDETSNTYLSALNAANPTTVSSLNTVAATGSALRTKHTYSETIFSSVTALRVECEDAHPQKIFGGISAARSVGVEANSLIYRGFTAEPSVITEGGIIDLNIEVTNFEDPSKNGGFCKVTNVLTDEPVLCFRTKGFTTTKTLRDCGDGTTLCLGDSTDPVVRETTYELECHHDTSNATHDDDDFNSRCMSFEPTGNTWKKIGPFGFTVKVLPSRIVERDISESVPVPTITKTGSVFRVSLPQESRGSYDVRIYELDAGSADGTKTVNPRSPDRIIAFFTNTAQANAKVQNTCDTTQSSSEFRECIKGALYGETAPAVIVIGAGSHDISRSEVSNKILVAETYTNSGPKGARSQKIVVDTRDDPFASP